MARENVSVWASTYQIVLLQLCYFVVVCATLLLQCTSSRLFSCNSDMISFTNIPIIVNIFFWNLWCRSEGKKKKHPIILPPCLKILEIFLVFILTAFMIPIHFPHKCHCLRLSFQILITVQTASETQMGCGVQKYLELIFFLLSALGLFMDPSIQELAI